MKRAGRWAALVAVGRALRESRRPGSPSLFERVKAVPRMAGAVLRREYPALSVKRLALMAAAVAYILSPVDLVPEALFFVLGVLDDAAVAAWLAGALLVETDKFLAWERTRPVVVQGYVV